VASDNHTSNAAFSKPRIAGTYHLADRIFRVARFSFKEATVVVTQLSDTIIHNQRERVLSNLLKVFIEEGMIINHGGTYGLADNVLKTVKQIPDWLKDGFVDAGEILAHFDSYSTITKDPSELRNRGFNNEVQLYSRRNSVQS
jgi:hypothetical protein